MANKYYEALVKYEKELIEYFEGYLTKRKDHILNVYKSEPLESTLYSRDYDTIYYVIEADSEIIDSRHEITEEQYVLMSSIMKRLDV